MAILNAQLQPLDAPVTSERGTVGYLWDTTADRGMVRSMQIQDFSFNQGTGGTLTLTQGMTIMNSQGTVVMDATGLNSLNNFPMQLFEFSAGTTTTSTSFVPLPGGTLGPIVLSRDTNLNFFLEVAGNNTEYMTSWDNTMEFALRENGTIKILIPIEGKAYNNGTTVGVVPEKASNFNYVTAGAGTHTYTIDFRMVGAGTASAVFAYAGVAVYGR